MHQELIQLEIQVSLMHDLSLEILLKKKIQGKNKKALIEEI